MVNKQRGEFVVTNSPQIKTKVLIYIFLPNSYLNVFASDTFHIGS